MKKYFALLLFANLSLALAGQSGIPEIEKTFAAYKTALLNENGNEVVQYLDSNSTTYFKTLLNHILHSDSIEVETLPGSDKMNVLMIRHLASKKEILAFTPLTLAAFAFTHGMGYKSELDNAGLGKVKVKGTFARARLVQDGKKTKTTYYFTHESNHWLIDIIPQLQQAQKDFVSVLKDTKKDENEFIFGLLELISDKKPTSILWKKIK